MKYDYAKLKNGGRLLLNLLTSDGIAPVANAPAAAGFTPGGRHLADVLQVLPVGPGTASIPRLVDALDAGVQSSEGNAAPGNGGADLEMVRMPFATVTASISTSKQLLDDSVLAEAAVTNGLREALRCQADDELAAMLVQYAALHTVAGSSDMLPALVEAVFAFQRGSGTPRAICIDHATLQTDAVKLIAGAPGVVSFGPDGMRIAGIPVVGCNMPVAGQALITSGVVLQREGESIVSSRMHGDNFVSNKVTLLATTRLAAIGPSLRVAIA